MQLFEPVLHVAALAVELIDRLGIVGPVRHDKPRVVLRRTPGMPHDLGLDNHSALPLPRPGRVPRLAVEVVGAPAGSGQHAGAPNTSTARRGTRPGRGSGSAE